MNSAGDQADIVRWLERAESYPHRPERVEHLQTHISHVFLAGPLVYKLKKPVRYDFLDFSTLSAREHACREELRLNRRLAPQTYLAVVPLLRTGEGGFLLGKADAAKGGSIVDWLVAMRRLPTEMTLEALHRRKELRAEHVERLAATLARFYRSLTPLSIPPQKYRERLLAHVQANRRELMAVGHHLPPVVVERVHGFQLQLLRLAPALFDERVRAGRIVDGHGDLRPEHICLSEPIAIFDCIEFSPEFRTIDVADELAFLAAECDFLGADWVGPQLARDYEQHSGDQPAPAVWSFYQSYRACVRAKVAALRADQLQGQAQQAAAAEAAGHLSFADRYAAPWLHPLVIAVGGLAGTGKTTLAGAVAEALGAELLRTDVVRQELFGTGPHGADVDAGIYRPESRERVYDQLFRRAAALHPQRLSVVLDGTFSTHEQLKRASALATDPRSTFLAVQCVCQPETAKARISRRLAAGSDASDARPELYDTQQARWQDWPLDVPHVRVDTEAELEQQVEQVLVRLGSAMSSSSGS